jgi:hypothetical protein
MENLVTNWFATHTPLLSIYEFAFWLRDFASQLACRFDPFFCSNSSDVRFVEL